MFFWFLSNGLSHGYDMQIQKIFDEPPGKRELSGLNFSTL